MNDTSAEKYHHRCSAGVKSVFSKPSINEDSAECSRNLTRAAGPLGLKTRTVSHKIFTSQSSRAYAGKRNPAKLQTELVASTSIQTVLQNTPYLHDTCRKFTRREAGKTVRNLSQNQNMASRDLVSMCLIFAR